MNYSIAQKQLMIFINESLVLAVVARDENLGQVMRKIREKMISY